MRNRKKWTAVIMAVCVMVPSGTVFAAPTYPGDQTITGDGVVEYDPEEIEEFINIVLPTLPTGAYDFTIDPLDILSDFSDEYDGQSSVYFKKQTAQAMLQYVGTATNDGKLYIKQPVKVDDANVATELGTMLAGSASGTTTITGDYYVWVPDSADKPMGKFEKITAANAADYIDYDASGATLSVTGLKKGNVNADATAATIVGVFDGKLYKDGYVELQTPYDVATYATIASDAVSVLDTTNVLYINDGTGAYTAVTVAADMEYVKAVTTNTGESDEAKIVNKSSNNTTVKVTATLTNVGDLGLSADDTFTGDTSASIYLAVKNGNSEKAIVSDGAATPTYEAVVECVLDGANDLSKYIVYQSGKNTNTGGHNYVRYAMQDMTYDETSFSLTAVANTAAGKAVWNEYAAGLTGTLPHISVVYHVEKAPDAQALTFKTWSNDDLWFGDGIFTDRTQLTSIVVVEADGSETGQVAIKGDDGNGYLNVTWTGMVAAGHDQTVITGYKLRVVYNGKTYELSL